MGRPAVTAASPQNFIRSWWKGVTAFSNVYLFFFFNKFSEQKNENFNFANPVQFLPSRGGGRPAASPQNFIKSWWKGVTAFSNVYLPKLFFNKFSEQKKKKKKKTLTS